MGLRLPRPAHFRTRLEKRAQKERLRELDGPPSQNLRRYRDFLHWGQHLVLRYHRQGAGGIRTTQCRALLFDVLITELYHLALANWAQSAGQRAPADAVALLALGGYGRSELCPYSDIDLMFLYPSRPPMPDFKAFQQTLNDTILYMLWDLGLKVGHSTRTPKEALAEAEADVQSKNAMIEARFLCGSAPLAHRFQTDYDRYIRRDNARVYIEARLRDQDERREKYGQTVFLQEPDLKNGVGGLRDYHNILWMARLKLDTRELKELVPAKLLRKNEHDALHTAYDFLLRVRTELHHQSPRATEVLDLEKQTAVAFHLGYRQKDLFARVEALMREVYQSTQTINRLAHYLEERLARDVRTSISFQAVLASRRYVKRVQVDGFIIADGVMEAAHERIFREDPQRLVRLFRYAQRYEARPEFELTRLIMDHLHRLDPQAISAATFQAFRQIFTVKGQVAPILRAMHETGVLARLVPEWGELTCLVQHEYYHRYTADEHTLNTLAELDRVFSPEAGEGTRPYRRALEDTRSPELLYLTLFLHDIGKGRGIKGHARIGAEMAQTILERWAEPPAQIEKIVGLIAQHLEMAQFWQHHDVEDPRVVRKFARLMGSAEHLRYLFVLTYCDARGTTPELWNSYKDSLHQQLYRQTLATFGTQPGTPAAVDMIPATEMQAALPDLSAEEIDAHYHLLPERYFIHASADEIELHLRMVHALLERISTAEALGSLEPIVEWREEPQLQLSAVHVVTWDRAGLFYKLAGAFSVAGLSIVSSKALTRADHITIDTFYVADAEGGPVRNPRTRRVFEEHLRDVLLHNVNLLPRIQEVAAAKKSNLLTRQTTRLPASLPARVDVYHELSLRRTVIEIQATDTLGLLYQLSKAIFDHGFDITFARIATERNVAVDTFYIEPIRPHGEEETSRLLDLRAALTAIVEAVSGMEKI